MRTLLKITTVFALGIVSHATAATIISAGNITGARDGLAHARHPQGQRGH